MTATPSHLTRGLAALALGLVCCSSTLGQAVACDQGIVRLPDRTGTVQICSSLAAQVPALSKQLGEAVKLLGNQQQQIRELTRLVGALNGSSAGLDTARQAQLLKNLSEELMKAERRGPDSTRRAIEQLGEQFEGLRDQIALGRSRPATAVAIDEALRGQLGDSIAQLELRSAGRQLEEVGERLKQVQADLGDVKMGVNQSNAKLDRIESSLNPANAADRCTDLECAIFGNASVSTVKRMVDNGARVLGLPGFGGMYVMGVLHRTPAEREQLFALLLQARLHPAEKFRPQLTDSRLLSPKAQQLALSLMQRIGEAAPEARPASPDDGVDHWNKMASCLQMGNDGVRLSELAALLGDEPLRQQVLRLGFAPPRAQLQCRSLRLNGGRATLVFADNGEVSVRPAAFGG